MPVFTTLEFFRSKQTIDSFVTMYPKSMAGLREAIHGSLDTINNMLTELTHQYLNGYPNHESFIRDKAISLHLLLIETGAEGVYRKMDFEMICDRAGASSALNEHINKIKDISKEISEYNPNSFTPIVELFENILSCMEKYFLSFYTGKTHLCPSRLIETPFNYENKRLEIIHDVKKKLRKIFNLSNQFNTNGIKMTDMGDKSNHIARRAKSVEMPCFLLFPESCDSIEEAKNLLLQWIEIDKEYPKAIKIDINCMNEEKYDLEQKRRDLYDECVRSNHFTDQQKRDYEEMFSLKTAMLTKLQASENESHETLVKIKHNEMTIKKSDLIMKGLEKKIMNLGPSEQFEKEINEHSFTIHKFSKIMKENKTKYKRIENKINWYKKYLKNLMLKKTELDNAVSSNSKIEVQLEEFDGKISTINDYQNHLYSILTLKSSNSTLKKIFHNLDFKTKLSFLPDKNNDKQCIVKDELMDAIQTTSHLIEKDWIKLYENLPFHPPRGTSEIENDIEKCVKIHVRGSREDCALTSLQTWRRFHIRANLFSLVETLQKINRLDIIKKLDCGETLKRVPSIHRFDEEKLPPMSATTRFLIKHYPNLQKTRSHTVQ